MFARAHPRLRNVSRQGQSQHQHQHASPPLAPLLGRPLGSESCGDAAAGWWWGKEEAGRRGQVLVVKFELNVLQMLYLRPSPTLTLVTHHTIFTYAHLLQQTAKN
jgi:hypothetical protein